MKVLVVFLKFVSLTLRAFEEQIGAFIRTDPQVI